jgi:hypothetical protein
VSPRSAIELVVVSLGVPVSAEVRVADSNDALITSDVDRDSVIEPSVLVARRVMLVVVELVAFGQLELKDSSDRVSLSRRTVKLFVVFTDAVGETCVESVSPSSEKDADRRIAEAEWVNVEEVESDRVRE